MKVSVIILLGKITRRCLGALTQHTSRWNRLSTQTVVKLKENQEESGSDGRRNGWRMWNEEPDGWVCMVWEERRKCSEVDQPRVKQASGEQVMHATIGVYRQRPAFGFSCECTWHELCVKAVVLGGGECPFQKFTFLLRAHEHTKAYAFIRTLLCILSVTPRILLGQSADSEVNTRGQLITWNMLVLQRELSCAHLLT